MSEITLKPYIFFTGNCQEAMEFYQGIFGGELKTMPYSAMGEGAPANSEGKLMHADLSGGAINFFASDSTREKFEESFISMSVSSPDNDALTGFFNKLSEGGKVTSPLQKESWGDIMGALTDKYGVDWLISITEEPAVQA